MSGPIVCAGQVAGGLRCGARFPRPAGGGDDAAAYETAARTAGWRLWRWPDGWRDAMCPTCARPDPALVRLCRELARPAARR